MRDPRSDERLPRNTKDSLNVMKRETVKHATDHLYLASKLRNGVRGAATEIESRVQLVRAKQRAIQKELKEKQEKEHQAAQSKHKYAEDCKKLKDLEAESESQVTQVDERATLALVEKVKDDITVSQREFAGLTGSLTAAAEKWVSSWKAFCDLCQTLEEDRLDEVKKLSRDYAGAISEVCIADDKVRIFVCVFLIINMHQQACKVIRTSLDLWSPEEENRLFVHKYGSGERIKEPVAFIDFQRDDSLESYLESTTREADFIRLKPDFQTEVEAVTSGHGVEFGTQTSSEVKPSSSKDSAPNDPRSEANLGEPFS